ncbi:MAG TPA: hypothetical protein PKD45_15275 [Flavobacteriales bacterium]|nr:hypothetical protein [Flavobacteriales bacterium]
MNAEATTHKEYMDALDELAAAKPLLGTHTIGALTVTVYHRQWEVTDGRHFTERGSNSTAIGMRIGINRAVHTYLNLYKHSLR